jgi:GMP synthase-like glutamine amidotransferase
VNSKHNFLRIAILDMYCHVYNQGMHCIHQIIGRTEKKFNLSISIEVFEVRTSNRLPGLDFDIYISTGGPGSPLESNEPWELNYRSWLNELLQYNSTSKPSDKKFAFFICHSFQLACRMLNFGKISQRAQKSEGIFEIERTLTGKKDTVFHSLQDNFWVVDSREYQVTNPNHDSIESMGGNILAWEKISDQEVAHRAVMAMRFNTEMMGTQFHPEADAEGLLKYIQNKIENEKDTSNWKIASAKAGQHLESIERTYQTILPEFLKQAIEQKSVGYD